MTARGALGMGLALLSAGTGSAPPPQVAGLLCKNSWFLHEARWAGQDARIQRYKLPRRNAATLERVLRLPSGVGSTLEGPVTVPLQ